MRFRKSIVVKILAFIILFYPFHAEAVVNFTKYGSNPVFAAGGTGKFDEAAVELPAVIKDGSTYRMWYTGQDALGTYRIGYATSSDGTSWTRQNSGNAVLSNGGTNDWDSAHVGTQWVMKEGSTYKMWFPGTSDPSAATDLQIGYATSTDGINWSKYDDGTTITDPYANSDPVLKRGTGTDWDADAVWCPTVIVDGGIYKMWFVGFNQTEGIMGIGYATSSDGISWTKYGSNPVVNFRNTGSWDASYVMSPTVVKEDSIYRMWYSGEETNGPSSIGYIYSVDGINWKKYHGNPIVMLGNEANDDFDEHGVFFPVVIKDGSTYKMWYTGTKNCTQVGQDWVCTYSMGYATAPTYQGAHLAINKISVASRNDVGLLKTRVAVEPEGPSPIDITELKVVGPGGFTYTFQDSDISAGNRHYTETLIGAPASGTYTFTIKTNNGLTATNSLNLTNAPIADLVDGTGVGELDRQINGGPSDMVYIGTTTPTFKFKPSVGDDKYYAVGIRNWREKATHYTSRYVLGSTKDGAGYLYVTVPANILPANAPYKWHVTATDGYNQWTAHNRSVSSYHSFYTGAKDTSPTPNFIDAPESFRSEHSFRSGYRAVFSFHVINLAPWDIDATSGNFSILNEDSSVFYDFSPGPGKDAASNPSKFSFFGYVAGTPLDAISSGYEFKVTEKTTGYYESVTDTFEDQIIGGSTIPRVSKKEMLLEDNAYLPNTTPTLSWISKGSGLKYQVNIRDWNGYYPPFTSMKIDGLPAGQIMSVNIPVGTLKEHAPYYWEVRVQDTTNNSRTRSQRLSFITGFGQIDTKKFEGDFDGNGTNDLLWCNTNSGEVAVWLMNGSAKNVHLFGIVPSPWKIFDVGLFDNNSTHDILWRHSSTGEVVSWLMNGSTRAVHSYGIVPLAWQIKDIKQFDTGNSTEDILWRNTSTGEVAVWLMNGATKTVGLHGTVPLAWEIVDMGHLDSGNTTQDLLWRNTSTGEVASWLMNGIAKTVHLYGAVPLSWQINCIEQCDSGSTTQDVLWRNKNTGEVAVWMMNGVTKTVSLHGQVPLSWGIIDMGHLDDGSTTYDILWRNTTTGEVAAWLMDGSSKTVHLYGMVPLSWQIKGIEQCDTGNASEDILWRNTSTGEVAVWLMNGVTKTVSLHGKIPLVWDITHAGLFDGSSTSYDILWRNTVTGEVAAWLMNGSSKTVHLYGVVPWLWQIEQ